MIQKILAESDNYRIVHEFENVSIQCKKDKVALPIGDFYGEPTCAMISLDETYAVIGGMGLVIYFLPKTFNSLKFKPSAQRIELFNQPDNFWEIESIYQSGNDEHLNQNFLEYCRIVVEKGENVAIYRLNVMTLIYGKISE